MKSGTSSYKRTWFLKNLTRFMPFWVLYTLCLLLGLFMMAGSRDFYFVMNLAECARIMAVINCGYGLLTAQLLFGDLYNSRMCYGIHSMPLRREEIFSLNIGSGLLFSLVPTAVMALCSLPMTMSGGVINGGMVSLLWFLASNLEYLFFFSLAVFCSFCAGSRFSMAVIYGILNFGSLLVYLLTEVLYMPLLQGVSNPFEWFQSLCPVAKISADPLMLLSRASQEMPGILEIQTESWIYLGFTAAAGLVLLAVSLLMYRRRELESAGEFVAVKALKPVFLLIFSLSAATVLNMVPTIFFGSRYSSMAVIVFTVIGLTAGWFVGLMLLEKTMKVFSKKTFAGSAVLLAVVGVSLLLTHLDVLHIASWVPDPQQVESVYVIPGYQSYGEYWTQRENFALTSQEDLETVTELHRLAIAEKIGPEDTRWYYGATEEFTEETPPETIRYTVPVSLEYHMKDGSSRRRFYYIYAEGEAGKLAASVFSQPVQVLRNPEVLEVSLPAQWMIVNGLRMDEKDLSAEDTAALLEAIKADMQDGNLAQMQEFHPVPVFADEENEIASISLNIGFHMGMWQEEIYLEVYSDSEHTMNWLRDRGLVQKLIGEISGYQKS